MEIYSPGAYCRDVSLKSGPRLSLEMASVGRGAASGVSNGRATGVRIAMGAVAPTPLRARATATVVEGQTLDETLIERAAQAAVNEVSPIDDVRASAWYRQHLTRVYTRRALTHVAGN